MTLFLAFSDTHGDLMQVERILLQYPQVDGVLHLGDYARDAAWIRERHPDLPVHAVCGNCDIGVDTVRFPVERELVVEGRRLLLTHGHRYGVKNGYGRLAARGAAGVFDLVLFGHTHMAADVRMQGVHLLNPGSPSHPKGMDLPSFALVEIGHGLVETRLMLIDT